MSKEWVSPAPAIAINPTLDCVMNHASRITHHTSLASPFIGPWLALARRSRFDAPELRRQMGIIAEPPEWFGSVVFGGPVQQWLHLARVWDAVAAVLEGRSQSETEPGLHLQEAHTFWTWSAEFVDITGGLPDQIIRVQRAACERGREVPAVPCGRAFPREEFPAACQRDLARLSALCRRRKGTGAEGCPQPQSCPFAAECLHSRLRSGVEAAEEAIATLALRDNRLRARLKAKWPSADEHIVFEAIERAVLHFLDDPCRFDPSKGQTLVGFLLAVALNELRHFLNELRHLQRTASRHRGPATETLPDGLEPGSGLKPLKTDPSPAHPLEAKEELAKRQPVLDQRKRLLDEFLEHQTPTDRNIYRLMLSGERHHLPYAKILGITHLPESEQRRLVIQHKNSSYQRLKLFLRSDGHKGASRRPG
jgi:hypothetical protein